MCGRNPRKWRFTWEAQSHTPILKLFLFDSHTNPSTQCRGLQVELSLPQSRLLVSWIEEGEDRSETMSLRVPIPKRVLIDAELPVSFRASDDHIEARLLLLLPVDHPIVSSFDLSEDDGAGDSDDVKPLDLDSDLKKLSGMAGVHFYCRNCWARLTRSPLKDFAEMPSVNWREVADNWFGACCCSFGGVSEKLVNRYAHDYKCAKGVCLLDSTAVTICKDDLRGCEFVDSDGRLLREQGFVGNNGLSEEPVPDAGTNSGRVAGYCDSQSERVCDVHGKLRCSHLNCMNISGSLKPEVTEEESNDPLCATSILVNEVSVTGCCLHTPHTENFIDELNTLQISEPSFMDQKTTKAMELMPNQRSFLNGFLGNVFMARSCNLSADIEWKQFFCLQCSSVLGAYPCATTNVPVDDGVRLFKCYISTHLPAGGPFDLFRKYTLERMFTNQLVESAKDELSFRTVVRDLITKSPMLQLVLLNSYSWCCSGECFDSESAKESVSKLDLSPVIKVLFSDCRSDAEPQSRELEDWMTKNLADQVYMFTHQIEELIETLVSAKYLLPCSCISMQGLTLSSMLR